MSPQQALLLIPGFSGAAIGEQIADGITANSWRVMLDSELYVLRIDKAEARSLGLDRARERAIQKVASRAGLTPELVFSDLEQGISLRRWITGRAWSGNDLRISSNLDKLGHLLRRIHALPAAGSPYQPGESASLYAAQLGSAQARETADQANRLLTEIRQEPVQLCLCHNDLLAANLIDTGKQLVPIDWEYAAAGDPLFDLAVLIQHHELQPELSGRLLQTYFGRAIRPAEALRLESWCRFYELLLELWNQRVH